MIIAGLKTEGGGTLLVGDVEIDLHNDFNLSSFELTGSRLGVELTRADGDWVDSNLPSSIRLVFSAVNRIRFVAGTEGKSCEDHRTLAYLGCLHTDDYDVMNGFLDLGQLAEPFHVILVMEDGTALKVAAEQLAVSAVE